MIIALESHKSQGKVVITDSEGYSVVSNDPSKLFEMMAEPYDGMKVVWDMEAFLKPILALLPKESRVKLNQGDKVFYNGTKLFWGVGKGQFFGVNYKKHLNGNFYEDGGDENIYQLKTFFPTDTTSNLLDIKAKGELLLDTLQGMGLKPTRLTSPASIISECILRKMYLPTVFNMPEEALECAEWAANYTREWRTTYKIGKWDSGQIWDYDCSAAYSSIMATLPNLRFAEYIHTMDGSIPEDIYWGILKGQTNIHKEISPIIYRDGKAYKGSYPDFITTDDWNCIRRWDIGDFQPTEGWFVRLQKIAYPFKYIMPKFYSLRDGNPLQGRLAKWMVNTVWGKMAQRDKEFGEFYFPPYACMTTSKMRCADCDFIYGNGLENDLVSVIVDGLLATRKVSVPPDKRFGGWRVNPDSPALVMSSSMQWVGDKKPAGIDVRQMLNALNAHPLSKSWNSVALRFLEHDRQFNELPSNGLDLLNNVYPSTALELAE